MHNCIGLHDKWSVGGVAVWEEKYIVQFVFPPLQCTLLPPCPALANVQIHCMSCT